MRTLESTKNSCAESRRRVETVVPLLTSIRFGEILTRRSERIQKLRQKQQVARLLLYVVACGCALLATFLCSFVWGPPASPDGEITPPTPDDRFLTKADTPTTRETAGGVLKKDTDAEHRLTDVLLSDRSRGTLNSSADGFFTGPPPSGFKGTNRFALSANAGIADANVAAERIATRSNNSLVDSFEGGDPSGWDDEWAAGGTAGSFQSGLQTTTEITPPTGGGSSTLRQWWHGSLESFSPQTLSYDFSPQLSDGDIFELEYDIYYNVNFDPGAIKVVKSIILQSSSEVDDRIYIDTHHFGPVAVFLQNINGSWNEVHRNSNIGGGPYVLPHGEWVHLRWRIKLASKDGAVPGTGYIYGWVNGVKRWEHTNVTTHKAGQIEYFSLNATINDSSSGPSQKRYWDSFSVKTIGRKVEGE
jgi:hypothetical protein